MLFNLYRKIQKPESIKSAYAILYPDKITIETQHQVKAGFFISAANAAILPVDVSDETLGKTIRTQLNLSQVNLPDPDEEGLRALKTALFNSAGFKTLKEYHQAARRIGISETNGSVTTEPTINGGEVGPDRGFQPIPEKANSFSTEISDAEFGRLIRAAWENCK